MGATRHTAIGQHEVQAFYPMAVLENKSVDQDHYKVTWSHPQWVYVPNLTEIHPVAFEIFKFWTKEVD